MKDLSKERKEELDTITSIYIKSLIKNKIPNFIGKNGYGKMISIIQDEVFRSYYNDGFDEKTSKEFALYVKNKSYDILKNNY